MSDPNPRPTSSTTRSHRLGLPLAVIVGLSALGVPRVVLHDLGLVHGGTFVNLLLVVLPPVVWVVVALRARVPHPFTAMLATGASYGVLLALVHQLLWDQAFAGDAPALGGDLATVDPGAQELFLRVSASVSSLFTGVVVGAICGVVARGLARVAADRAGR